MKWEVVGTYNGTTVYSNNGNFSTAVKDTPITIVDKYGLKSTNTTFDIWLDKSNGMIVKMVCNYSAEGEKIISTTMLYRYKIGSVTDEEVQKPNLEGYTIIDL